TAVFPSRKLLAAMVVLAALAAGVVMAYLVSVIHPVVGRVSELKALTGRPVLGSISVAMTDAGRAAQRQEITQLGIGLGLLLVLLMVNLLMTTLMRSV
ncbi:MAG: hypothetical protein ACK57J_14580, partial [Rubrivivax sp.]